MGFSIPRAHWTATFILKVRFLVLGCGSVVEYLPVQDPRFPRLHSHHSSSHNNNTISLKGEAFWDRMGYTVNSPLTWAATTVVHTQDAQRTPNCPHFPWHPHHPPSQTPFRLYTFAFSRMLYPETPGRKSFPSPWEFLCWLPVMMGCSL